MIPFQFHITMNDFSAERQVHFRALCADRGVKPLLIELSHGNYIHQPMFTQVVETEAFADAQDAVEQTIAAFEDAGYSVARKKAEVPPEDAAVFAQLPACGFSPYYEWHCKVRAVPIEGVRAICAANSGVLSRNSLDPDGNERYVTLREYGGKPDFDRGVAQLLRALQEGAIAIVKQKFEYCIFDSRLELDGGWAS